MKEDDGIPLPLVDGMRQIVGRFDVLEAKEKLRQNRLVILDVVDDVDLIEEDKSVEYSKSGIVENAGQHDIFEVQQAVSLVNLVTDRPVFDLNDLAELSGF